MRRFSLFNTISSRNLYKIIYKFPPVLLLSYSTLLPQSHTSKNNPKINFKNVTKDKSKKMSPNYSYKLFFRIQKVQQKENSRPRVYKIFKIMALLTHSFSIKSIKREKCLNKIKH